METKMKIIATVLLAVTAVLCASYTVVSITNEAPTQLLSTPTQTEAPMESSAPSPTSAAYFLCASDGYVAVRNGADAPLVITSIALSTLRAPDRALIEAGLVVGSREALISLREAFCS